MPIRPEKIPRNIMPAGIADVANRNFASVSTQLNAYEKSISEKAPKKTVDDHLNDHKNMVMRAFCFLDGYGNFVSTPAGDPIFTGGVI
jgi:hypothetical protein